MKVSLPGACLRIPGQLVVEGGVAVAEEEDEGPDAEGGAEGELEEAEEGGGDGDDAPPLRLLVQAPCGKQGQGGADQEDDPDKVDEHWAEPLGAGAAPPRAVPPRTMLPRTEVIGEIGRAS